VLGCRPNPGDEAIYNEAVTEVEGLAALLRKHLGSGPSPPSVQHAKKTLLGQEHQQVELGGTAVETEHSLSDLLELADQYLRDHPELAPLAHEVVRYKRLTSYRDGLALYKNHFKDWMWS